MVQQELWPREEAKRYYKLDTPLNVFFYEQEFYVLSNFSSFRVKIWNRDFYTSEHAYHWAKFPGRRKLHISNAILQARSAHDAFKIAQDNKNNRHKDWEEIKVPIMEKILKAKVDQHPYVKKKLLETGNRILVEDSWRDSEWGWGVDRQGKNLLGKLWMQIRKEIREKERC